MEVARLPVVSLTLVTQWETASVVLYINGFGCDMDVMIFMNVCRYIVRNSTCFMLHMPMLLIMLVMPPLMPHASCNVAVVATALHLCSDDGYVEMP